MTNQVCHTCNHYFGNNLEIVFRRDTNEAVLRYRYGLKNTEEVSDFVGRRIEFRVPPGTPWEGARLYLGSSPDGTNLVANLIPQIGIRSEFGRSFRFFSESEFQEADESDFDIRTRSKFRILAHDQETLDRLNNLVRSRLPRFRVDEHLPPAPIRDGQLDVELAGVIDQIVVRTVAKIAFNYLAHQVGASFALDPSFDAIRRFVRYGERAWRNFASARNERLLADEDRIYRHTRGHIVIVEWKGATSWGVRAWVSPFDELSYTVLLSRTGPRLWWPIDRGHHFDWETHQFSRLTGIPSPLLPAT